MGNVQITVMCGEREREGGGLREYMSLYSEGAMGGRHHPHIAMSHGVLRGPRGQHYEKENRILGFPLPSTNPPNFLTYQLYSPLHILHISLLIR